ncbi:uncharacterized protein LOC131348751 isoform X2 [Hemibagrus wyckioides]|uniref:uncharacterized protein LOC131348751 isoform X2 n=1 Tax=Hemibagrus wyckioides TaxID=337641 RepID=UPI00266CAB46|nr:uncharacterized protein LOC131348751 isoform X2 [Hemibagrus wyckioides]
MKDFLRLDVCNLMLFLFIRCLLILVKYMFFTQTCLSFCHRYSPQAQGAFHSSSRPVSNFALGGRVCVCVRYRSDAQVNTAVVRKWSGSSRRACTHRSTTSKVAYFKRKYAEEEDVQGRLHGYLQKHLILREERSCILRLSLQKLRFLDDPEAFLRRAVLINNLLRKIHSDDGQKDRDRQQNGEKEEEERLFYLDRKRLKVLVTPEHEHSIFFYPLNNNC